MKSDSGQGPVHALAPCTFDARLTFAMFSFLHEQNMV